MRYTHLSVSNVLSFGPQRAVFPEFKRFNLFIGPNGSGKSNVLRLLGDIESLIEFCPIANQTPVRHGQSTTSLKLSMAKFNWSAGNDNVIDKDEFLLLGYAHIEKEHEVLERLKFQPYLIDGDLTKVTRAAKLINEPLNQVEFHRLLLEKVINAGHMRNLAVINLGIRTVFGERYQLAGWGALGVFSSIRPGSDRREGGHKTPQRFEPERWPSGIYFVVSVLMQILGSSASIVLIDEPERHLEPLVCRRFIRFLFWLCLRGVEADKMVEAEEHIEKRYTNEWNEFMNEDMQRWLKSFGSTEGEPIEFHSTNQQQLFIASHSSTLIQEFLNLGSAAEVYQFRLNWEKNNFIFIEAVQERTTEFTAVRSIDTGVNTLLDELGCKGSDILQANGIVWVEGPSDVVYLRRWLEMYCEENSLAQLRQGLDFEFQMFGGALLDSLSLKNSTAMSVEEQQRKLIEMFSFSRNAFVIIDSDAVERDGVVVDQSNFSAAKAFIKLQFELLQTQGFKLGLWFEYGNTEKRTLEDYLDSESVKKHGSQSESGKSKKRYAQAVVQDWTDQKVLSDFPNELSRQIENLAKTIRSWNEH